MEAQRLVERARSAGVQAVAVIGGEVRLPEGVTLSRLTVSDVVSGADGVRVVFEAWLEIDCERLGEPCPSVSVAVEGPALSVWARDTGVMGGRGGVRVTVAVRVNDVMRSLLRIREGLEVVAQAMAYTVRRVVEGVAFMAVPGRERVEAGGEECMDFATGYLRLMELLVEEYGLEEGMRRFDEYLEKPGYIVVGDVEVIPREYEMCFRPRGK